MLTIFTSPKPFSGQIAIIQRNAIISWSKLNPPCEIILFGDEVGVDEIAREFGLRHIKHIRRNEYGTPLINDLFEQAQLVAHNDIMCYVNSDIILLDNFMRAVSFVSKKMNLFLLIGKRWDVDINKRLLFDGDWEKNIINYTIKNGMISSYYAIDFFVFCRGTIDIIPPFAIGRPAWDNWFIYNARKNKFFVIDGSDAIFAIHQNHDYSHVQKRVGNSWEGPEADQNRLLAGGYSHMYTINDANYKLTSDLELKFSIKNLVATQTKNIKNWFFSYINLIVK